METQSTFLAYVFTKTSHMSHRPSTHSSLPAWHSPYQPVHTIIHVPEYSLRAPAHYHIHACSPTQTPSRIIITHLCNKTANM